MTSDFMSSATSRYGADEFISFDESSDRPWGFKQVLKLTGIEVVAFRGSFFLLHARQMTSSILFEYTALQ